MSGGHFDYRDYQLTQIVDSIKRVLNEQGKPKPKEELYMNEDYYKKHPEEKVFYTYPTEVQEKMKEGIKAIKIAAIYAHRIDWFLSGDDGEESFLERLSKDLKNIS